MQETFVVQLATVVPSTAATPKRKRGRDLWICKAAYWLAFHCMAGRHFATVHMHFGVPPLTFRFGCKEYKQELLRLFATCKEVPHKRIHTVSGSSNSMLSLSPSNAHCNTSSSSQAYDWGQLPSDELTHCTPAHSYAAHAAASPTVMFEGLQGTCACSPSYTCTVTLHQSQPHQSQLKAHKPT